ncbi:MAG: cyclic nucleotide-binding protein, partial [Deltaproteobacteria bacterium]
MGLINSLREAEPFNQLPEEIFTELNQSAEIKNFPAQTLIFNQHAQPTGFLYVIKSGLMEIVDQTNGGV